MKGSVEIEIINISIHAPPRGATLQPCLNKHGTKFQFTPLREGRLKIASNTTKMSSNFNSRPSARGDLPATRRNSLDFVFQFTPLREGRRGSIATKTASSDFNSRPSARGDVILPVARTSFFAFQFTPLREGRPDVAVCVHILGDFNSRPSARGD